MNDRTTQRQRCILEFIQKYTGEHQYPPTVREIAAGCKLKSTSVVNYHLERLQNSGYITRQPFLSRSIVVVKGE